MIDAKELLKEKKNRIFVNIPMNSSWCHFYELPFLEHLSVFVHENGFSDSLLQIAQAPNQVVAMAESIERMDDEIDAIFALSTQKDFEEIKVCLPAIFATVTALYNSFRCVLVFGCYLNDLIANVRIGDDRSLFNAVRLDPTILGCPTVINRVSQAYVLDDKVFMRKLKSALNSRLQKREQANFKKMRLILQVLTEAKAERLTNDQLYELFVEQLDLYSSDSRNGDVIKNLRKFADQYMTTHATT